ncbi:MAG TPA: two-component system activity regulator YycH [Bacillota bacterium]|nr:two-component system activity regulator YycH [Bacillota bacterium]
MILNLLVILSLVLSWTLLSSQPKYDYLHPAQYLDRQPLGDKREVKQLVKPQTIIFHYGNKKYTGATPDSTTYRVTSREMDKWYFFNLKKVHLPAENLKEIMSNRKAMEIIFPDEIPADLMGELFTFRGKTENILPAVKRIIIYIDDTDKETYALFCDNMGSQVQGRTAITSRDLEQFYLSMGNTLPSFMPVTLGKEEDISPTYIPNQEITMQEYRYFFQPILVSQMMQTLFVDPSMVRQVTERDGTIIYTDGSKAVQIPPDLRSIHYHDPVADSVAPTVSENHFHSVLNFLNEHGGWNGDYLLEEMKRLPTDGVETYQFRQYVGSYPFYGVKKGLLGSIEVETQGSYVSGFQRSLVNLDSSINHQNVKVISGQELLTKLTELGIHLEDISDLLLGYQAKINENHLILSPKWIIKQEGKDPVFIEATAADKKEDSHGLEKGEDHTNHSVPPIG